MYNVHSLLDALYSEHDVDHLLHTVYTVFTVHSSPLATYSTQCTQCSPLATHCTQCAILVATCGLVSLSPIPSHHHFRQCTLDSGHYTLYTVHCSIYIPMVPPSVDCTCIILKCPLNTVDCPLSTIHYTV